jgi:L-rhamnose mutarotase
MKEAAMERIAVHTRLKPGAEAEYERVHAVIPEDLDEALRAAGVTGWRIWRNGRDLFHVVDVEDFAAMRATLRQNPVNQHWQARMAELLEVTNDYSTPDNRLGLVWELP